jgi:hypothetical protein
MTPVIAGLVSLALLACGRGDGYRGRGPAAAEPPRPVPAATSPATVLSPTGERLPLPPASEETKPVYPPTLIGPESAQAARFCQALHALPAQRRADCCGGPADPMLLSDCVRVVTYAERSGAVQIDAAALAACEQGQAQVHPGCDWVGPWPVELPAACRQVLRGTLLAGARCRSSLECGGELFCHGAGPTQSGTCGPALGDGERCGLSVDALAAYTRLEAATQPHPQHTQHRECAGFCNLRHVCEPLRSAGEECVMSTQCAAADRCGKGRCTAGRVAQVGQPCSGGDCAPGLRCYQHVCQAPKPSGSECTSDFDCLGGCQASATDGRKRCAPKCSAR